MSEKAKIIVERLIKIVCILLCCLFFVPAFTVSCASQNVDVTPIHSVFGYYAQDGLSQGEVLSNPAPWCLLLFAIPFAVFLIWLILSTDKKKIITLYAASVAGVVFDFVMWNEFKKKVFSIAEEWAADVEPQFGYKYSIVFLIILLVLLGIHAVITYIPNTNINSNSDGSAVPDTKCSSVKENEASKAEVLEESHGDPAYQKIVESIKKSIKSKNSIGYALIVIAVVALICVVVVVFNNRTINVDLSKYLCFEYEGYSSVGTVQLVFDETKFDQEVGRKIHFTSDGKNAYGSMSPADAFVAAVERSLPAGIYASDLENGERVTYEWDEDLETLLEKYFKVDVVTEEVTSEAFGLMEAPIVDVFSDISISVDGVAPNGQIVIDSDSNNYSLNYTAVPASGLSNGDEVTITVSPRNGSGDVSQFMLDNYQVLPESTSYVYTVDGLSSYAMSASEISDDLMNQMQSQALSAVQANVAEVVSNNTDNPEDNYDFISGNPLACMTTTLTSIDYAGNYCLTLKSADNYGWNNVNRLVLIYRVNLHLEYYIPEDNGSQYSGYSTQEEFSYFMAVTYNDIVILPDGSCSVDLSNYQVEYDWSQEHDVTELESSRGTDILYYYGYSNFETLKNNLVTQNVELYNYEDNVDMSIVNEALVVETTDVAEEVVDG